MNEPIYSITAFLPTFLFLSAFYLIPVCLLFLLIKNFTSVAPSPYSLKAFLLLCAPGLLYGLLESVAPRQGFNFLLTIPIMILIGMLLTLFLRKINLPIFILGACTLAIVLWGTVPKSMMKIM